MVDILCSCVCRLVYLHCPCKACAYALWFICTVPVWPMPVMYGLSALWPVPVMYGLSALPLLWPVPVVWFICIAPVMAWACDVCLSALPLLWPVPVMYGLSALSL